MAKGELGEIAACGRFCGCCPKYLKEKCPGCSKKSGDGMCKVRPCAVEHNVKNCAECIYYDYTVKCKVFNSERMKLREKMTGDDFHACIDRLREIGAMKYAVEMQVKKARAINDKNRNEKSIWDNPNTFGKL